MVLGAVLKIIPFIIEDPYLSPVKILSQSLLPFLRYSLISLQKTLGGNHHPPRLHGAAKQSCKYFS
jgi:hypothetical protein